MTLGLNDDDQKPKDEKAKNDGKKSDSDADEAQEILKQMQAKEDDGDCAFC